MSGLVASAARSDPYTILLGGVGGDCHSVGLTLLRQALAATGYRVLYLGTQNRLEEFFEAAGLCNVVMVSSMDGHSRYYLRSFPELRDKYQSYRPLWYLGGNLDIGDGHGLERHFREMGFDRVFVKFADVVRVLDTLAHDLHEQTPMRDSATLWARLRARPARTAGVPVGEVDDFECSRGAVLAAWDRGWRARSLDDNADFLRRQPSFARIQAAPRRVRRVLVQPRCGVALLEQQIELFRAFKSVGVKVLSYQVDSLTRNNDYRGAQEAIRESRALGASTLNGFPAVNHGVDGLRRVITELQVPLQTRHSTRDPRLLAEISFAGGVTSFEGGAICYNIPYYKDYPLEDSLRCWQYVDWLTGLYRERFGVVLDREFFGTLTGTLVPPCLAIVVNVLQALLAARRGVKSVSLGYAEQGHRVQDIAAIRCLKQVATEVMRNMGHADVQINTVFHQYMAAFPSDVAKAVQLISNSAGTAALAGATRLMLKTPVEASRIPTLADNLWAVSLAQRGIAEAESLRVDERQVAKECRLIRREVSSLLDSVIYCGGGNVAAGIATGFAQGLLDVPFSPSIHNRGEVLTARDVEGAVRFLSTGNLQLDAETRQFHAHRMGERRRAEGLISEKDNYLLVEKDLLLVPRNQYERWPLHG
jgi:methylaspartate mutase epsilon subunit